MRSAMSAPRSVRRPLIQAALALVSSLGVAFVSVAVVTPSAGAARTVPAVQAHTSAYCAAITTYSNDESNAMTQLTSPASIAAQEKAAYANLKAEEPKILAIVPSQIHSDYVTVFNGVNQIYQWIAAAGYNFLKLAASTEKSLEAEAGTLEAASNKITAYNKSVCGAK